MLLIPKEVGSHYIPLQEISLSVVLAPNYMTGFANDVTLSSGHDARSIDWEVSLRRGTKNDRGEVIPLTLEFLEAYIVKERCFARLFMEEAAFDDVVRTIQSGLLPQVDLSFALPSKEISGGFDGKKWDNKEFPTVTVDYFELRFPLKYADGVPRASDVPETIEEPPAPPTREQVEDIHRTISTLGGQIKSTIAYVGWGLAALIFVLHRFG